MKLVAEKWEDRFSPRTLTALGVGFGVMSWVLESFIHSQIFYEQQLDFLSSLLMPDRHELWMRCLIVALFVAFGLFAGGVVKVIRKARDELAMVNIELARIFDTAADGMRVIGSDYTVLRVNSTFCLLSGVTENEVLGAKCYDVFRGESCHTASCPMLRIQAGEERVEYDAVKIRMDGRRIPCIVTATPFYDHRHQLVGIVEDFKDISERKRAEQALCDSHRKLRLVTARLEMVREQERQTISREIHDELGQNLTGLKMDLHWLKHHHAEMVDEVAGKLSAMDGLVDKTIDSVRRIASEIRPGMLDDLGLQAAIEAEAGRVRDRLGLEFDIDCHPEDMELDGRRRITVFRIFKEALTNIVRHAGATRVVVRLRRDGDQVTLLVSDNGRGITREEQRQNISLGLMSMHERAWLLGGSVRIVGGAGEGTTVFLSLPYTPMQEEHDAENPEC